MVIDAEAYPIIANDGVVTILTIILPIMIMFLVFILALWITDGLAKYRALKAPPIGYSEGMVLDKSTGRLKGTKTAVHYDPVSGKRYFGKTVYE